MSGDYAALVGRVQQALADLERVVSRAESLMDKAQHSGDDGYLDGVALNLHGSYVGIERIFEDIAREVEASVPSGPDWHQDLLLQMSAEVAAVRPAVITQETRQCLGDYRAFRHVVRNVYAFNSQAARLKELTGELRTCYQTVCRDVSAFTDFLEQLAQAR